MKDKEIHAEIESLKAQLTELQKSREEAEPQAAVKADNSAVTGDISEVANEPDSLSAVDNNMAHDTAQQDDLITQFQELINVLNEDIKQTKPATLLVIFALGVLVGRLLPR